MISPIEIEELRKANAEAYANDFYENLFVSIFTEIAATSALIESTKLLDKTEKLLKETESWETSASTLAAQNSPANVENANQSQ